MDALLAIKPEFAEKILSGEKRYEFRRTSFRSARDIDFVYLYSSAPVMKIVGGFESGRTIEADPDQLWELYSDKAGIDRERFMEYFEDAETGYAIQVDDSYRFEEPIDPDDIFEDFTAPMSFLYLNDERSSALQQYLPAKLRQPQKTSLTQYSEDSGRP
jgi:type I restriction enzyme S subunit